MEFDADVEKIRLIETAEKLFRKDIKVIETSNTAYPTCEEMASEDACIDFLPETLRVLLEQLIVGKPYNYSRYSLSLITFSFLGSAAKKNCICWAGYCTGTCVISTTGCSTTPSLCIVLS